MGKAEGRKNIQYSTFKKIETFLKQQKESIAKSDVARMIGVDYNSLKLAISMMDILVDKTGKISIGGKENV